MHRKREPLNFSEETVALLKYLQLRGLPEEEAVAAMEFAICALTRGHPKPKVERSRAAVKAGVLDKE